VALGEPERLPFHLEAAPRERAREVSTVLSVEDRTTLASLDSDGWWQMPAAREALREPLMRAAAWYFLHARNKNGTPVGSINISASGIVTFTGSAFILTGGADELQLVGSATPDTATGFAFSIPFSY
jgi:hypothetical protein